MKYHQSYEYNASIGSDCYTMYTAGTSTEVLLEHPPTFYWNGAFQYKPKLKLPWHEVAPRTHQVIATRNTGKFFLNVQYFIWYLKLDITQNMHVREHSSRVSCNNIRLLWKQKWS